MMVMLTRRKRNDQTGSDDDLPHGPIISPSDRPLTVPFQPVQDVPPRAAALLSK